MGASLDITYQTEIVDNAQLVTARIEIPFPMCGMEEVTAEGQTRQHALINLWRELANIPTVPQDVFDLFNETTNPGKRVLEFPKKRALAHAQP